MDDFLEYKGLTKREIEIVNLIMLGLNNEEIAKELMLIRNSIVQASSKIFKKLNVINRTELILMLSFFLDKNELKEKYEIKSINTININDLKYLLFQNESCEIRFKSDRCFKYKTVFIDNEKLFIHRPATGQKHGKEYRRDTVNLDKISFIKIKNVEYKLI